MLFFHKKEKKPAQPQAAAPQSARLLPLPVSRNPQEKDIVPKQTEQELFGVFAEYFAPNKQFYSQPGSPVHTAYFQAINNARFEILSNLNLFQAATKWTADELETLLNGNNPSKNMILLGLIFRVGWFSVYKDALYCVDFGEKVPNCIALYLLLIAQKEPPQNRRQVIDAGDNTDPAPLRQALKLLKICDPSWDPRV